jgi:hypothetical protein
MAARPPRAEVIASSETIAADPPYGDAANYDAASISANGRM